MGKLNHGPASRAIGKAGAWVYQQYEGMQVFREYNPNVKNPQTTKQVENRAKFKLSSQITAQFKEVFSARLSKLSIYERMRRAASVNAIYNVVDTTTPSTPETLVASVIAAINAKSMSAIPAPTVVLNANGNTVTAPVGHFVIIINAEYDKDGAIVNRTVEMYTSDGTAKAVTVTSETSQVIMVVSTHALTEDGRATISNAAADADKFINTISRSVASGDLEISNIAGGMLVP